MQGQFSVKKLGWEQNPLWITPLPIFIVAGFDVVFGAGWWRWLAIIAAVVSLVTMALFGEKNMVLGVAMDVAI